MAEIDNIIHQPARLRIMAAITSIDDDTQVDFTYLRDLLGLTDGNLGAHIQKREQARYLRVKKTFVNQYYRNILFMLG